MALRRLLATCCGLAAGAAAAAPSPAPPSVPADAAYLPADSPAVLWTGRSKLVPGRGVAFDWEGVSATFSVSGSGIWVGLVANITLNPTCAGRVSVFVNGFHTANMLLHADVTSYLLAAGLKAPGPHLVTVVYTMEPVNSCSSYGAGQDVAFTGFTTSGAFVGAPPPQLARRIDIVGDSITAGSQYDPEHALPVVCNDWLVTNSVTYNWESYLCRQFGANCTTIAWSGKGLINNGGCSAGPNMTTLFKQTEGGDSATLFDFSRASRPDALIVYLGTNDYSCAQTTDAIFTQALVEFVGAVISGYAQSPGPAASTTAFIALGPMSPTRPLAACAAAVAQLKAAGVAAFLLNMTSGVTDGCGGHPGALGHRQMALQAAPQIQAAMGW
jgi:hypothetical protein